MVNKIHNLSFFFKQIVFLLFVSCAAIMPPPGGPKDETPPELVKVTPPDGTTYFEGGKVELLFSEYLNESSYERAITVLPLLSQKPEISFKGNRLIIDFPDSLSLNQTYIISISRDLSDEHKVKLSQGIQVAFSTGPQIDKGLISGFVDYEKDASLNLWKIQNENDSLDFYKRNPDYVIDASSEGFYEFKFLSQGQYRIAAVDRLVAGTPIIPDRFVYGLSWVSNIGLGFQDNISNVNMKIPKMLGGIKMINAESLQGLWGRITFSESIESLINEIQLKIIDEDSLNQAANLFEDPNDNTKIYFLLDSTVNGSVSLQLDETKKWNSTLFESGNIKLTMEPSIDTTDLIILQPNPKYRLNPEEKNVKPLKIIFSNLVGRGKDKYSIILLKDSVTIPYSLEWDSPIALNLLPHENWKPQTNYELQLLSKDFPPVFGRALKDSLTSINFKTSDYKGFGNLIINIISEEEENIVAKLEKMEKPYSTFRSVVNLDGETVLDKIPEGNYSLTFFQDTDNNMQYSYGTIDPYKSSEWFYNFQDTVKVRSNWDIELQEIKLDLEF
ncbi:MAG: Ig-like domain-containing protein [Candidatus Neomarinimicrobiota bacterium]